jgi:hypothetical protein
MTTATGTREPEMGLTFEKIWALFQESDRRFQESAQQIRETAQQMRETAQQMRETDRKLQEVAEQIKKTDAQMKKTDAQMKKTDEQLGRLGNRFGELAEHLVGPNIAEKFNARGFNFRYISGGMREIVRDKSEKIIAEFDILLENGDSIVGVEVKAKPSERDVENHVQRLEIFRRYKDTIGDKRKIYGALAGAIMADSVKNFILKEGLYAITQTGDTVKIDVPEGFVPKAW